MNTVYEVMWKELKEYIEKELHGCSIGAAMSFSEASQGTNWLNQVKTKMKNIEKDNIESIQSYAQEKFYDSCSFS